MISARQHDGRPGPAASVLAYLKTSTDKFLTSREIAGSLNSTRPIVYESISQLRSIGYGIEASRNRGYRLVSIPDTIAAVAVSSGLRCKRLANRIFSFAEIDSTNTFAHELAEQGFPDGTLVIADSQIKGKGRMGRRWHSPKGKGLYFSLILRPKLPPDRMAGLSLMAGLALIRAIKDLAGTPTLMKWPNDILYQKRKLAGVLVELVAELDKIEYMIVGVGVNVNNRKKDFPLGLQLKSTSLKVITGKEHKRAELLQEILVEFENLYETFCRHGFSYIGTELKQHSAVVGKRVTLTAGKVKVTGLAVGFDDMGGLIIKSKSGLRSYSAGEVTLR